MQIRSIPVVVCALFVAFGCGSSGNSSITKDTAAVDATDAVADSALTPDLLPDPDVQPELAPEDLAPDLPAEDVAPDLVIDVVPETVAEDVQPELQPDICSPSCDGKECGDDGCGDFCGECGENQECTAEGLCDCLFELCSAACCTEGGVCHEGSCCTPVCDAAVCGGDGCGGSCGECQLGYDCGEDGQCGANCDVLCETPECGPGGMEGECDCGLCDDGNGCTDDACLDGVCEFVNNDEACDDGNPCTGPDMCADASCAGPLLPADELEGLNCLCQVNSDCLPLEDGNVCNGTLFCNLNGIPSVCEVDAATVLDCDDSIECTMDSCDAITGCAHEVQHEVCDDEQECTTNACIAQMGCLNSKKQDDTACGEGFPNICLDGLCTCVSQCDGKECGADGCGGWCGVCDIGCECAEGTCIGGCGECIPECDGIDCGPDGCGGSCGTCEGNTFCNTETWLCDDGQCQIPTEFPGDNLKVTWLKMGTSGQEGQAVDVDQDPDTCAPAADCADGRDNQFAGFLKSIAIALGGTEPLVESVEDGKLTLLYEMKDVKMDGTEFTLNIYRGDAVLPKEECNFQTEVCDYEVLLESFNEDTCLPVTTFDNSQLLGNTLVGGGQGYFFAFPFVLGLAEGKAITFMASSTRIVATVQFDEEGKPTQIDGIIGCAIPEADILTIADAIPEDKLPLPKAVIVALLQSVVNPDIDSDGDGVDDAVSASMLFTAKPGNIVGLE